MAKGEYEGAARKNRRVAREQKGAEQRESKGEQWGADRRNGR